MTIVLYQFGPIGKVLDPSPFCVKLMGVLHQGKIQFTSPKFNPFKSFKLSPRGQLPYIEDNGILYGDSNLIIDYLCATYQFDPDAYLSPQEKAISISYRRLLDNHLYWAMANLRWLDKRVWQETKDLFFASVPSLIRPIIAWRFRKKALLAQHIQGMGRFDLSEVLKSVRDDLSSLSLFLENSDFFFGQKQPTLLDWSLFGFTHNLIHMPFCHEIQEMLQEFNNLINHEHRLKSMLNF